MLSFFCEKERNLRRRRAAARFRKPPVSHIATKIDRTRRRGARGVWTTRRRPGDSAAGAEEPRAHATTTDDRPRGSADATSFRPRHTTRLGVSALGAQCPHTEPLVLRVLPDYSLAGFVT